ncbi:hypothetical protein GpartN1_g3892.t1 [Galdieria partita]|uniref:CUE domain-containing protein n=1 Tax=Galdieria partita TaxID=83374 RepID=A0A9C7UQV2_9RHOD|nr:hypothetical protein GpartN1_g3892.t1 [Galdieria partita]
MDQQYYHQPNTQREKKLLEQLFQGGVKETNTIHESHSVPHFPIHESKTVPSNTFEEQLMEKGFGSERKRSMFNLGKLGEKIVEKRSLRKRVKESATVKQLCARFPELEQDAISAAYAAHGGNKNLTVNYLLRALGSRSTKENSFSEEPSLTPRCNEEEPSRMVVQDSQVAMAPDSLRNEQVTRENFIDEHNTTVEKHSVSEASQTLEQSKTTVDDLQPPVIPGTNNMALSRRRNSDRVKLKKSSDERSSQVLSYLNESSIQEPTKYTKTKSNKQRILSASSRLSPEDIKLLNSMPKNAKEAFYKRMRSFHHHESVFFKEDGCESWSHSSLQGLDSSSLCKGEKFEKERLETQSSDSTQVDKCHSSYVDKEYLCGQLPNSSGDIHRLSSKEQMNLEQSQSSMYRLERRLLEMNEELHKLDVDTSQQIVRLDSCYNNIHSLLDDLYARVHHMECKLDELTRKQTNGIASVRRMDSYWSSSFWLLLDGIGFLLWYCLLKPIVLVYGLFCGKKQRHHRRGSRDSIQFGSGDLSKTLAFLMSTSDKDS